MRILSCLAGLFLVVGVAFAQTPVSQEEYQHALKHVVEREWKRTLGSTTDYEQSLKDGIFGGTSKEVLFQRLRKSQPKSSDAELNVIVNTYAEVTREVLSPHMGRIVDFTKAYVGQLYARYFSPEEIMYMNNFDNTHRDHNIEQGIRQKHDIIRQFVDSNQEQFTREIHREIDALVKEHKDSIQRIARERIRQRQGRAG